MVKFSHREYHLCVATLFEKRQQIVFADGLLPRLARLIRRVSLVVEIMDIVEPTFESDLLRKFYGGLLGLLGE
jgi:hypothetical protein